MQWKCTVFAAIGVLAIVSPSGASTLIPMNNHYFEQTYDPVRNLLYIPTRNGTVERYDVASDTLLDPFVVGAQLGGSDITTDGNYLYVADAEERDETAFLYKFDLEDSTTTTITLSASFSLAGLSDIAIMGNGLALVTGLTEYSSNLRGVLALDTNSDSWTDQIDNGAYRPLRGPAFVSRSADRSVGFLMPNGFYGSRGYRYNSDTNSFFEDAERLSKPALAIAVSRDGSLFAVSDSIYRSDATHVMDLPRSEAYWSGLVFDPLQDVLYAANRYEDSVYVFDTNTWEEIGQIPVGEDLTPSLTFDFNHMTTSSDGRLIFMNTRTGVRVLENPFAVPEPAASAMLIMGAALYWRAMRRCR